MFTARDSGTKLAPIRSGVAPDIGKTTHRFVDEHGYLHPLIGNLIIFIPLARSITRVNVSKIRRRIDGCGVSNISFFA